MSTVLLSFAKSWKIRKSQQLLLVYFTLIQLGHEKGLLQSYFPLDGFLGVKFKILIDIIILPKCSSVR